jgi:hypothetical protein
MAAAAIRTTTAVEKISIAPTLAAPQNKKGQFLDGAALFA